VEAAYLKHFATTPARASVSFLGVELIEVLRFDERSPAGATIRHYLSLGMARHPMVAPDETLHVSAVGPRAELLVSLTGESDEAWRPLSVLAAAPAVESAVYGIGGRVDLGQPWLPASRCTGAVLAAGPLGPIEVADSGEVAVLRVIPAHPAELAWARVHGNEALLSRWQDRRTDLYDLWRDAVSLS
jgi:hypothetical protein